MLFYDIVIDINYELFNTPDTLCKLRSGYLLHVFNENDSHYFFPSSYKVSNLRNCNNIKRK